MSDMKGFRLKPPLYQVQPDGTYKIVDETTLHDRVAMHALEGLLAEGHLDPYADDKHRQYERDLCVGEALAVADAYMAEKARREAGDDRS